MGWEETFAETQKVVQVQFALLFEHSEFSKIVEKNKEFIKGCLAAAYLQGRLDESEKYEKRLCCKA